MIHCGLSNKLWERNEQFKSSERVRWKGVQLKRRAGSRQRHGKVIFRVSSSSLRRVSLWPERAHTRPGPARRVEGKDEPEQK